MNTVVKKTYDFVFSCGYSCAVTQALRAANLQFASFPFDWMATPSFPAAARMVADGFAHWMDRDDLELVDIRRGGIMKHVYRNRRNGFGFVHDFTSFRTFDENYPRESAKYVRRIERFMAMLNAAEKALAINVEWPILPRLSDTELAETRAVFAAKFPKCEFELVYFYEDESAKTPRLISSGGGISVYAVDYRTFVDGEVNHEADNRFLIKWLEENVEVADPRSAEEKATYAKSWERQDRERWKGGSWWRDMVNRTKFRQYRRLEKFLVGRGLLPRERPLWVLAPSRGKAEA